MRRNNGRHLLRSYLVARVTAAAYEFDEPPDAAVKKRVAAARARADAVHDDASRLVVAALIAAHFDFALRLKAHDGDITAAAVYRSRSYELSTSSFSGVPLAELLAALPLRRPALARARAAALEYFRPASVAAAASRRTLLGWRPSLAEEANEYV